MTDEFDGVPEQDEKRVNNAAKQNGLANAELALLTIG